MNIYFKATFCIVKEIFNIPGSVKAHGRDMAHERKYNQVK
jgi:hypothetical protein